VDSWVEKLKATKRLREGRAKVVKQLAIDIVQLWKDDSQLPSLSDANLSEVDRRILTFAKAGFSQAHVHLGLSPAALDALVQRKHDLVICKQDRIRTTLEITKRLRLIEDRIVLVNLMNRVEAQAANPLRLFGDSTRLQAEDRFRRIAYPRLLMIEATLRPALLLYRERHRQPFRYKGEDYLQLLDDELKTRKIPRGVFACTAADLEVKNMKAADVEQWFGSAGDDGNVHKGLSDALVKVIDRTQPDFAKVLALSAKVTDVMAERILQKTESDLTWMKGTLISAVEADIKSDELKLLELGWQLPTTSLRPDVRRAAVAKLREVVPTIHPEEEPEKLQQRYFKKAANLGIFEESVNNNDNTSLLDRLELIGASSGSPRSHGGVSPKGKHAIPPFSPRPRKQHPSPPALPVGPSGRHGNRSAMTTSHLNAEQEQLYVRDDGHHRPHNAIRIEVAESSLAALPPPVCVDPRPCTCKFHGASGTCGDCRAHSAAIAAQALPTAVFDEPVEPRMLDASQLVPRCMPPADVKHLRVSAVQLANMRQPRHLPLAKQAPVMREMQRRDEAFKPSSPRSGYRPGPPPAAVSQSARPGTGRR
jgi:hypothetical protein